MKIFRSLKHYYDNLRIQTKFSVCILLAMIIPILTMAVAFSNRLYDMIIADTIRNEQTATLKTAPLIEDSLNQITDFHARLIETDYYRTLFYQPVNKSLAKLAETEEACQFSENIRNWTQESIVTGVRIYLDIPGLEDFYTLESAKDLFLPISYARGTYWYGIFQGQNISSLYCPPFYLGNREMKQLGDSAYITSTSIYYHKNTYPCYIAVYYSSDPFTRILSDGISSEGSVSYIINERDALIASSDAYLAGIYRLNYADIAASLMSSNNFIERSVLGKQVYVGFYYMKEPSWIIVTILPIEPMIKKGTVIIFKFIIFCIICVLAVAALAIWQARSITTRISSVIHQMTQVRKGPPVPMPAPVIQDEVGELINTYNYMTEKMNQLMEQQKKTSEELRIAEFNSLQAQINPHFLYNTMDMINWMALKGQTAEVSNVVQSLARFYKLTLSRKKKFSTIESELEHVSIYVQLQNMRYQNAIDFVIDIPDELHGYSIPKLTLQPIVENAILHGILEKEEKTGTIVITGWMEEDGIILLVSDDGVGIPAEKLPLILSGENTNATKGTNIAVYNIHRRLKLLYGSRYGLSYTSTFGQGCDVRILLPKQPADEP